MPYSDPVSTLLLDIEGTTTPVAYVFEVLFPFARDQAEAFLETQGQDTEVQADLTLLRQEYQAESNPVPQWEGDAPKAAVPYIHHLIAIDRKSTGLKSLQGKIWNAGYQSGQLRSQLFPDVKPAFERWQAAGKTLYIFSSGSVQAQKLIFRYSQ
ncbi:MAG: acireductone synthase, partial [Cyanobacteria bacterium P01_A01_bin.114]